MSFFTPNTKCRRLGLGRSVNKSCPGSTKKNNPDVLALNQETPNAKNNLSDSKVINSSQKRKYRLGTSCRKNYKKKKLEFVEQSKENSTLPLDNKVEDFNKLPCASTSSTSSCSAFLDGNEISECTTKDVAVITKEVEEKREILSKLKEHENNVSQLRATIEQWRSSLIISLNELSSKIEPNRNPEEILDLLNIPIEIVNTK